MQNTDGFTNLALANDPNYAPKAMVSKPVTPKKNRWITFGIPALALMAFIVIMTVLVLVKNNRFNNAYGDFDGKVDYSYWLDYVLTNNYELAGREAITEALEEYYLPKYPSGVGLSLVRYDFFGDYGSFRVVSSYGQFEDFAVRKGDSEDTLTIIVNEFESERHLDYQKYNDEEFDSD